ncbi:azole resistance protein 1 [Arthroderma uncinatum]|uniref:azole resistance protein 1 n=1 Tax=Arthroderma uncinatum TaxID=74035 RepID=UPI00144AB8FB|nr:azole resistance protein 1 [Arthroderma uncinatum]KAF3482139.1 azole resistance protein 1 [Arthroderma uncinatum]
MKSEIKPSQEVHPAQIEQSTETQDDNSIRNEGVFSESSDLNYPHGIKLAVIISSLAISVFLVALDETIITTAIPKITNDFRSIQDIGWYGSAYFMPFAAFQLIFGKLFSFYPIKYVFLASIFIFEVGSLICGTAPTSSVFILGRAIAGLGSAGINAGFIIQNFSKFTSTRKEANISPLLGGAFTTKLTWRWCFYINLPIGGIALLSMAVLFHPPKAERQPSTWREKIGQMDLLGTAVLVPGIFCLLLALQLGGSVYEWNTAKPIALVIIAAASGLVFVLIQCQKQDSATLPPRIIKQRSVACSACYVFHAGGALSIFHYFLPIWFQAIQGITAFDSGTRILPTTVNTVIFSVIAGIAVAKWGYYTPLMIQGASLLTVGGSLMTSLEVSASAGEWIGYQIIVSAGAGLGIQQAHTAAQTVLPSADVPTGAVVIIFAQILGSTVWLSVAQQVMTSQLRRGLSAISGLDPNLVFDNGATGFRTIVEPKFIGGVLHAYNAALTRTFLFAVALAAVALVSAVAVEFRSVKKVSSSIKQR